MSAATNTIDIEIKVTFKDDSEQSLKVQVSDELYHPSEIPGLLEDTLARAARAINVRIREAQK